MTFGEKLQRLRSREGLSQDRLAELLGVTRQAISKWERDETMPEAEKIVRISDCFGVTTDYLLKDGPEKFPAAARRLPDLEVWYREKGYQLGWILAVLGVIHVLRYSRSILMAFSAFWQTGLSLFALYVVPGLLLAACGVWIACAGRRYAGRLRGQHLGWLGVLAGLSGCLWLGGIWLARFISWHVDDGIATAGGMEGIDGWQVPLGVFLLLILMGALVLWAGKRRADRHFTAS